MSGCLVGETDIRSSAGFAGYAWPTTPGRTILSAGIKYLTTSFLLHRKVKS